LEIYYNLNNYTSTKKAFVTLGTFDGLHTGHQKVLKNLVAKAHQNNAEAVLLTFFPHPRMVLQKEIDIKLINTLDERIQLLKNIGLDVLIVQEFNTEFSNQTAYNFVKNILVNKLNTAHLIIGYDHHFGKNREGNLSQLKSYAQKFNFKISEISKLDINNIAVSSTKIRLAIEQGNMVDANTYLGYPFMLTGEIVKGKNLGEKIGFPTANLFIKEAYKLLPKTGAYIVKSEIDEQTVFGMMNIGYRPTVAGKNQTIEIHFFNLNQNLYGKIIQIDVLSFLRNEIKFDSVAALQEQLQLDKATALNYISNLH
jgi:riboflavin kinase/FMN adenylyltransferase